jgi:hypothetical protein
MKTVESLKNLKKTVEEGCGDSGDGTEVMNDIGCNALEYRDALTKAIDIIERMRAVTEKGN